MFSFLCVERGVFHHPSKRKALLISCFLLVTSIASTFLQSIYKNKDKKSMVQIILTKRLDHQTQLRSKMRLICPKTSCLFNHLTVCSRFLFQASSSMYFYTSSSFILDLILPKPEWCVFFVKLTFPVVGTSTKPQFPSPRHGQEVLPTPIVVSVQSVPWKQDWGLPRNSEEIVVLSRRSVERSLKQKNSNSRYSRVTQQTSNQRYSPTSAKRSSFDRPVW